MTLLYRRSTLSLVSVHVLAITLLRYSMIEQYVHCPMSMCMWSLTDSRAAHS